MKKISRKRNVEKESEEISESKKRALKIMLAIECTLAVFLVAVLILHNLGVIGTKADTVAKQETSAGTAEQQAAEIAEEANNSLFGIYVDFLDGSFKTKNGDVFEFTPGEDSSNGSFNGYISKDEPSGSGNYEVTTDGDTYYVTISSGDTSCEYIYSLDDEGRIVLVDKKNGDTFILSEG